MCTRDEVLLGHIFAVKVLDKRLDVVRGNLAQDQIGVLNGGLDDLANAFVQVNEEGIVHRLICYAEQTLPSFGVGRVGFFAAAGQKHKD